MRVVGHAEFKIHLEADEQFIIKTERGDILVKEVLAHMGESEGPLLIGTKVETGYYGCESIKDSEVIWKLPREVTLRLFKARNDVAIFLREIAKED